jgi:hypothetical protein
MPTWFSLLALCAVGGVAGALNVIAGGGSFLTLPVLIFLGLPPTVANGTNRVGILTQNLAAAWGFHRHRLLPWRWTTAAAIPATGGALLGTWAALLVSDEGFKRILAVLMVVVTLVSLVEPPQRYRRGAAEQTPPPPTGRGLVLFGLGFFLVGVYGGFVQAGAGFFILAVTTWAGLDLVRGNALKVWVVLIFTVLSLALFGAQGLVRWLPGLALGVGNFLGGWAGAHLTVAKGHRWVKGVVLGAVVVFAVLLWVG